MRHAISLRRRGDEIKGRAGVIGGTIYPAVVCNETSPARVCCECVERADAFLIALKPVLHSGSADPRGGYFIRRARGFDILIGAAAGGE